MPTLRIIDDKEDVLEPVNQTLCEICQKQFSNYVCPRCNLRYCSLACYKDLKHADCTESFYKESVTAEIQSRDLDKNSKIKMMEMLRRLQEENNEGEELLQEEDDEDDDDFISRFEDLDLDQCDASTIWKLLSEKERGEFEAALKTGNLQDFALPLFQPWWWKGHNIIQDMQVAPDIPNLPDPFPDFEKLTKPQARDNPQLLWNMLNILSTYSYLVRHTMGDLLDDVDDTLHIISSLSADVLYSTTAGCSFTGVSDVVTEIVQQISNVEQGSNNKPSHLRHYELKLLLLEDLKTLTVDDFHIRAIHDFWQALDQISKHKKKKKKSLLLAVRKLYFYLAAACYKPRLATLHFAIETEHTNVTLQKEEFEREYDAAKCAMEEVKKQTHQIQEL
ncbi:hypothetical protein K501DRAFT_338322 [Backusella circina FSU 941]|nr:hypothetical protein K501DRAFT_338322 [Backusella circina FSU 941]